MIGLPKSLRRLLKDRRGNIAITTALMLPLVISCFGLGAETASWMTSKRTMQNAADAAAIAAATNAGSSYGAEAQAVALQYGFKNGTDNVTVAASNTAACPDGSAKCYSVTVTRVVPLMLAQITGYSGDATLDGRPAKLVSATAVATQGEAPREYCVLALDNRGASPALRTNGAPKANLAGCDLMSNGDADCNGHNLSADHGDAHGKNDGCGIDQASNVPKVPDPYEKLADKIPGDTCPKYDYLPSKKNGTPLPEKNKLRGTISSTIPPMCGDVQLAEDVTLTKDQTIYIYNGQLDTNGKTIRTAPGVTATIVFTGDNSDESRVRTPTGGGKIDITAPKTGDWAGMAIYQDPALRGDGLNISEAGNSPTWDITGVVYLPHSSVTFSGAVNKSSNGKSCFALVVDQLLINGTGSILAHGECEEAGVTLPTGQIPTRGKLVL